MLADVLLDRRRPGDELEAQSVVDHGEAAGGEREPLPVGAGDVFALVHSRIAGIASLEAAPCRFLPARCLGMIRVSGRSEGLEVS
jgi:hypothetical protein